METFGGLLALAAILLFVVCLIGLIFPRLLKHPKTGTVPQRKHLAIFGLVVPLVMFAIGGSMLPKPQQAPGAQASGSAASPDPAANAPAAASSPTPSDIPNTPEKSLGITPEEFRTAYNAYTSKIDKRWNISKFKVEDGAVRNTFNAQLGSAVHLVGTVNKQSGKVHDLMLIVGGGKGADNVQSIAVLLSAAHATTQGASKEEISSAVSRLTSQALKNVDDPSPQASKAIVGNREYTANASQLTGLMFAISDATH